MKYEMKCVKFECIDIWMKFLSKVYGVKCQIVNFFLKNTLT